MNRETLFLKIVVFLLGLPILAVCIYVLPWIAKEPAKAYWMLKPILIVMYVTVVPFFIALYKAYKLLTYIDRDIAFSELSVKALKNIKYCAITISVLYAITMPFIYLLAKADDAPGIVLIGLVLTFSPIVVAVFAAVLEKLLKYALDIKSENDLTV
ncbi:MAG: DUF2975 domain-containing protein [bacterium]